MSEYRVEKREIPKEFVENGPTKIPEGDVNQVYQEGVTYETKDKSNEVEKDAK